MANEGPNRIRDIPEDQLSPAQKTAIEAVLGGRGRIPGPYRIWLHSPPGAGTAVHIVMPLSGPGGPGPSAGAVNSPR